MDLVLLHDKLAREASYFASAIEMEDSPEMKSHKVAMCMVDQRDVEALEAAAEIVRIINNDEKLQIKFCMQLQMDEKLRIKICKQLQMEG